MQAKLKIETVILANLTGLASAQVSNIQKATSKDTLPIADWTMYFTNAANCQKAAVNLTRPAAVLVVDTGSLLVAHNSIRITNPTQIILEVSCFLRV